MLCWKGKELKLLFLIGSYAPVCIVLGVLVVTSRFFLHVKLLQGSQDWKIPSIQVSKCFLFVCFSCDFCVYAGQKFNKKFNSGKSRGNWETVKTSENAFTDGFIYLAVFYCKIKQVSCSLCAELSNKKIWGHWVTLCSPLLSKAGGW